MSVLKTNSELPDGLLRSEPPTDQHDEPMQAGRNYIINNVRCHCFEDPDDGNLYQQPVTKIGTARANSRPVHVLMMPAGDKTVHRLED